MGDDLVSDHEMQRILEAAVCPVCKRGAIRSWASGGTMGNGIKFGSGARGAECENGHRWESAGWDKPFVVVHTPGLTPGEGETR